MTNKEINERIEKINSMLSEVSSLGWEIADELYKRHGIEHYDASQIEDENERAICETANECGLIEGWGKFQFGTLRMPEDGDGSNDDDELPSHIVERCKYVSQPMDTTDLCYCDIEPNKPLKVPVDNVRWNYPFEVEKGDFNVYHIETARTWGELLTRIVEVFQREYAAHECEMAHELSDYIIEPLEIHPNGLATVYFGS